jgi:hypothetical protein
LPDAERARGHVAMKFSKALACSGWPLRSALCVCGVFEYRSIDDDWWKTDELFQRDDTWDKTLRLG